MKEQKELLDLINEESNIKEIQKYLLNVMELRGFINQSVQDKLVLLIEEIGELCKSIRKSQNLMGIDKNKIENYSDVEEEIADVFIVLMSIANILEIDVYSSFHKKEMENIKRKWK